ncbi:MAG: PilZ domain-containing protein [Planctomycetes bacterium]|nr:PilZ domain-containing protein [Planctomycetota bacterium]
MQEQRERRRHERTPLSCPARILDKRKRLLVKGKTADISASGVMILGPLIKEPKLGSEVNVEIELLLPSAPKSRTISRTASVRRVQKMGEWTSVALEFADLVDLNPQSN